MTIQFIVEVGKTSWFDAGMKLKAPRIQNFFTAKAYLREFFEENKQTVHGFSYRSFASDIDWPTSYLHDVISGRKKFTVMRAVQLAEFLSLHSLDTERLIYFALSEEADPAVQSYSQERIQSSVASEKKASSVDYEFFENIEFEVVLAVLIWARQKISPKEIKSLLYTFPELSEKRIAAVVSALIAKSLIHFDKEGTTISYSKDLALDEHGGNPEDTGVRFHGQYAESFLQFTKSAQTPCMYNSGFYEIPRKDFMNIAHRILEVRNWVFAYIKAANEELKSKATDTLVFQFDLNLFTILDKTAINNFDVQNPPQDHLPLQR